MNLVRLALPFTCLLLAGCPILANLPKAPNIVDYSGITSFTFARTPGLGFCPPIDAVFSAEITVSDDGEYVMNMSILEEGTAGEDECLADVTFLLGAEDRDIDCATVTQLAEQVLTAAQVEALQAVLSEVEVYNQQDPSCVNVAIDPCMINVFTFDESAIWTYPCTEPRLAKDQAEAFLALLDEFRGEG